MKRQSVKSSVIAGLVAISTSIIGASAILPLGTLASYRLGSIEARLLKQATRFGVIRPPMT